MRRARTALGLTLIAATITLTACTKHYAVRDPAGDRVYYTTKIDKNKRSDAVTFTDARTGAEVTLQNHDIRTISSEEYEQGIAPASDDGS